VTKTPERKPKEGRLYFAYVSEGSVYHSREGMHKQSSWVSLINCKCLNNYDIIPDFVGSFNLLVSRSSLWVFKITFTFYKGLETYLS
jgi:hypothetical protein